MSRAADAAVRQIPPLWPLSSSVAVNPFLGQSEATLAQAAARLSRVGEVPVVMPRSWYAERIASGEIAQTDLAAALVSSPHESKPLDLAMLEAELDKDLPIPNALRTVADLVAERSGTDWPGIIAERIGVWAGGYFDRGQRCGPPHATGPHGPLGAPTRRTISRLKSWG
tara:strand:- start:1003 stop:1509 length:507 start_codon:yes stop_codon:yes gene_type:complete